MRISTIDLETTGMIQGRDRFQQLDTVTKIYSSKQQEEDRAYMDRNWRKYKGFE